MKKCYSECTAFHPKSIHPSLYKGEVGHERDHFEGKDDICDRTMAIYIVLFIYERALCPTYTSAAITSLPRTHTIPRIMFHPAGGPLFVLCPPPRGGNLRCSGPLFAPQLLSSPPSAGTHWHLYSHFAATTNRTLRLSLCH